MGWNFYTYMIQPPFFLDEISLIMKQENENAKRDNERLKENK